MLFLLPKGVINLVGRQFGELTPSAIVRVTPAEGAVWNCLCSCGGTREVPAKNLTAGRVTRCLACANARRVVQLREAHSHAADRRGDSKSSIQRDWRKYLEGMSDEQRAAYDEFIARRERLGMTITDGLRASAVEATLVMSKRLAA